MTWLDAAPLIDAVGALAAVLALLLLMTLGLRFWRARQGGVATPRLAVRETLALDARHRLVRVRDGASEHLILLGPATALIVDRGSVDAGEDA